MPKRVFKINTSVSKVDLLLKSTGKHILLRQFSKNGKAEVERP